MNRGKSDRNESCGGKREERKEKEGGGTEASHANTDHDHHVGRI